MVIVSIDPGKNGGVCVLDGIKIIELFKMPTSLKLMVFFQEWAPNIELVVSEKPLLFAGKGTQAIASQNQEIGYIRALTDILDLPLELIEPKTWQDRYDKSIKIPEWLREWGFSDSKLRSLAWAMKLYPNQDFTPTKKSKKPSDGMSDAVLIGRYWIESQLKVGA